MVVAEKVNVSYGNVGNLENPVFLQALSILEKSGLLSSDLLPGSPARPYPLQGGIDTFKNPSGGPAIALEVIVDAVSRAILKGYQDGFSQGVGAASIKSDGASNINFKIEDENVLTEDLTKIFTSDGNVVENVHEAIVKLGLEIAQIKTGLQSLGVPLLPIQRIPSTTAIIAD